MQLIQPYLTINGDANQFRHITPKPTTDPLLKPAKALRLVSNEETGKTFFAAI